MKNIYVFDLDNTLYEDPVDSEYMDEDIFYSKINKNLYMNKLLFNLKNRYLFSNGTNDHVNTMKNIMDLNSLFSKNKTVDRDQLDGYIKPHKNAFKKFIKKYNFNKTHNIYFFEDNIDNLKEAKHRFKWNTILIDKNIKYKPEYVDYVFKNIEHALLFFNIKHK